MVGAMETFDETCGEAQQLTGGGDGLCLSPAALSCEAPDWRALYEAERVRADAAEASMRDLRCAEIDARARADTLQFDLDHTRDELEAARADLEAARTEVQQGQDLVEALEQERDALKSQNAKQKSELRKLRGTRDKHAKARFGSKSEKRKKKGTGNKRGQQPGKSGHGRTPRPKLEEKHERHDPPASQRTCPCCGEPYVANGSHETSIMEVHVKAHVRRIDRGRWRRGCQCSSAPGEIIAPPPLRLFANTPYGNSVWACVLYERFACLRPLRRVSRWLKDQGLPMAPGTIAGGMKKMTPMFAPLAQAILDHQNRLTVRHGDEASWVAVGMRIAAHPPHRSGHGR